LITAFPSSFLKEAKPQEMKSTSEFSLQIENIIDFKLPLSSISFDYQYLSTSLNTPIIYPISKNFCIFQSVSKQLLNYIPDLDKLIQSHDAKHT
jgi:hypothetical protein